MSTTIDENVTEKSTGSGNVETPKQKFNWGSVGTTGIIVLIILWCLLPFYWMLVLAFRDPAHTFDTTPFFTHNTFSNFQYAFDTTNNTFGRSLINSLII